MIQIQKIVAQHVVKVSYVLPRVFKIIKFSCIRMDNIVYFCCQEHTCLSLMLNNLFYTEKIKNIKCILRIKIFYFCFSYNK